MLERSIANLSRRQCEHSRGRTGEIMRRPVFKNFTQRQALALPRRRLAPQREGPARIRAAKDAENARAHFRTLLADRQRNRISQSRVRGGARPFVAHFSEQGEAAIMIGLLPGVERSRQRIEHRPSPDELVNRRGPHAIRQALRFGQCVANAGGIECFGEIGERCNEADNRRRGSGVAFGLGAWLFICLNARAGWRHGIANDIAADAAQQDAETGQAQELCGGGIGRHAVRMLAGARSRAKCAARTFSPLVTKLLLSNALVLEAPLPRARTG